VALAPAEITKDAMRRAFASYAACHEPASIRRCWSTWNVLCEFLFTADLIGSNPMPLVGRPKAARTLPRALPQPAVHALIEAVQGDRGSSRRADWYERDLALILTALLARSVLRGAAPRRRRGCTHLPHRGSPARARQGQQGPHRPDPSRPAVGPRDLPRQPGTPLPARDEIVGCARPFTVAG
jgi:hypothetical protein